jgi:hypothetical protein
MAMISGVVPRRGWMSAERHENRNDADANASKKAPR